MAGVILRFLAVFSFFLFVLNGLFSEDNSREINYIVAVMLLFTIPFYYFSRKANRRFLVNLGITAVGLTSAWIVVEFSKLIMFIVKSIWKDICSVTTWGGFVDLNIKWAKELSQNLMSIFDNTNLIDWIGPPVFALSEILIISGFIYVVYSISRHFTGKKNIIDNKSIITIDDSGELWEERKMDLSRLKENLRYSNILGIDSPWGEGKTFLADYFCRHDPEGKSYHTIKIEALNYKYDEYDEVLISQVDSYLRKNHVFSMIASNIRSTVWGIKFGELIYRYFQGWKTGKSSIYEELREKVNQLPDNKRILIVFEDLERVKDAEAIKKIWAISERLASDKIKFVYEYDGNNLDDLGLTWNYREKYIPLEMSLTSLTYDIILNNLFKNKSKFITLPSFLKNIIQSTPYIEIPYIGQDYKLMDSKEKFHLFDFISIRKVKSFLDEVAARNGINLNYYTIEDKTVQDAQSKIWDMRAKVITGFCFVKYFMHDTYRKLMVGIEENGEANFNIEDYLKFKTFNKTIKLKDLGTYFNALFLFKRIQEFRKHETNMKNLAVFGLLRYPWKDYFAQKSLINDKQQENRNRVNCIVAHLLQSGIDEQTEYQKLFKDFLQMVLNIDNAAVQILQWVRFKGWVITGNDNSAINYLKGNKHSLYSEEMIRKFKNDMALSEVARAISYGISFTSSGNQFDEDILGKFMDLSSNVFNFDLGEKVCLTLYNLDIINPNLYIKTIQFFIDNECVWIERDEFNYSKSYNIGDYFAFLNKYVGYIRYLLGDDYKKRFYFSQPSQIDHLESVQSTIGSIKKLINKMLDEDSKKEKHIHNAGEPDKIGDLSFDQWKIVITFLDKNQRIIENMKEIRK